MEVTYINDAKNKKKEKEKYGGKNCVSWVLRKLLIKKRKKKEENINMKINFNSDLFDNSISIRILTVDNDIVHVKIRHFKKFLTLKNCLGYLVEEEIRIEQPFPVNLIEEATKFYIRKLIRFLDARNKTAFFRENIRILERLYILADYLECREFLEFFEKYNRIQETDEIYIIRNN